METITVGLIFGIAVVDSINPSALLATGYILQRAPDDRKTRGVLAYVAGIFGFYFLTGVLLLLGLSVAIEGLRGFFESRPAYILQAIFGLLLFAWSWIPPKPPEKSRLRNLVFNPRPLFLLGITVTLVEFATALPYLGAITLLQNADVHLLVKLGILVVYNLIFVLPPLGMLAFYHFNRERFTQWHAKREARRGNKPDDTMQWIVGAVGVLLFLNALSGLGFEGVNISFG